MERYLLLGIHSIMVDDEYSSSWSPAGHHPAYALVPSLSDTSLRSQDPSQEGIDDSTSRAIEIRLHARS